MRSGGLYLQILESKLLLVAGSKYSNLEDSRGEMDNTYKR